MSETNYERCHVSYRGYLTEEIEAAREVLRRHGKPCALAVKELRDETDMPMSECSAMLRCLWRDTELERTQAENEKLRQMVNAWRAYATKGRSGLVYERGWISDENVVTYGEEHGFRLYSTKEVYGWLHDAGTDESLVPHDMLPDTIPLTEIFEYMDV